MLELQKFCLQNPDWEKKLSSPPYSISIKKAGDLILFKYSQIESDFKLNIVCESRGTVLKDKTFEVMRYAFYKFFNQQESLAAKLDPDSIRILEKVDGSLISIFWYDNRWVVSTSGTIDAFTAFTDSGYCFGELFHRAAENTKNEKFIKDIFNNTCDFLNPTYCYSFELISQYNRVVVPYKGIEIRHLSTRDMVTLKEIELDIGVKKPTTYSINTIEGALKVASELPWDEEGYVAVDKYYNRVKIKSPQYVAAHHLANNGAVNEKSLLTIVRKNEKSEFLTMFPEYTEMYNSVESAYNKFKATIKDLYEAYQITYEETDRTINRRKFADWAMKTSRPDFLFALLDGKVKDHNDYINNMVKEASLLDYIGREISKGKK